MSKNRDRVKILMSIGVILIPVVIYFVPLEWLNSQHSICLFRNLTGHDCYGCGMTRAIFSAIHFRFDDAFNFNKLYIIVLPLLIYIWAKTILSLWMGSDSFLNWIWKMKGAHQPEDYRP